MLKGGVIGFGGVGRKLTEYINNQRDDAEIVAACDIAEPLLDLARDKYNLAATNNADELVNMDLDFVMVLSCNHAHPGNVIAAANAGKHIFCEKPIALTLADCDKMVAAVEAAGVINVVNYSYRYIPTFAEIKQMIDDGKFGDIISVWSNRTRGYGLYCAGARHESVVNPKSSGGWAIHHSCHGIDLLSWFAGPIESVSAMLHTTLPDEIDSEEVVHALLRFKNGAVGFLNDTTCTMREHHTGVVGTKATLIISGEGDDTVMRFKEEGQPVDGGEETIIPARDAKTPGTGVNHFLDCLKKGEKSPVDIKTARHSIAVAIAMKESSRQRKEIIIS